MSKEPSARERAEAFVGPSEKPGHKWFDERREDEVLDLVVELEAYAATQVAAEREDIARMVEELAQDYGPPENKSWEDLADSIRARGK